jgi:hypothetical protein
MRWLLLFIGVLVLIVGGLLANAWIRDRSLGKQSVNWPTANGVVTEASVRTSSSRRSVSYSPYVRYEYSVEGRPYWNSQIQFWGEAYRDRKDATPKYVVGEEVRVFYRPNAPQTSVLEPGDSGVHWLAAILAVLLMAVGIGLIWIWKMIPASAD